MTKNTLTTPNRKRDRQSSQKRVTWSPILVSVVYLPDDCDEELCYCHLCKYEVLCESCDLPEDKEGPISFVPVCDEDDEVVLLVQ